MVRKFEDFFVGNAIGLGAGGNDDLAIKLDEGFAQVTAAQQQTYEIVGGMFSAMRQMYDYVLESAEREKRFEAQIKQLISDIATVKDATNDALTLVKDAKQTHYVGKGVEVLEQAMDAAKDATFEEVRELVNTATKRQPEGYREFFGKIRELTGFAVWRHEKCSVKKKDGLVDANGKYSRGAVSWINTLFLNGYKDVMYVVAKEMINR